MNDIFKIRAEADPDPGGDEEQDSSSELVDPEESSEDETTSPGPSTGAEILSQLSQSGAPPVDPGDLGPAVTKEFRTEMVQRGPFKVRGNNVFPKTMYRTMSNSEKNLELRKARCTSMTP